MPLASQIELPERYRVARHIASGGMASVWEVEDLVLGRIVAVKVLGAQFAFDPRARARFQREARTAAQVSVHPHVVTIYDIGEHGDDAFIVMEHFSGGTVADRLRDSRRSGAPIDRETALRWLRDAASGLDVAHAAGIVHRDVKPANLLLDARGRVAVADFGIARLADDTHMTQTGQVLGTAAYLSPEQATGQPATPASDRYALAVVAYELLSGRRPFDGGPPAAQLLQHAEERPPRASEARPELPSAVDPVLIRGLAKNPAARPSTATEFVGELERALRDQTPSTSTRRLTPVAPEAPVASPPVQVARGEPPSAGRPARLVAPSAPSATAVGHERSTRRSPIVLISLAALAVGVVLAISLSNDSNEHSQAISSASRTTRASSEGTRRVGAKTNAKASPLEQANRPPVARPPAEDPAALNDRGHALNQADDYTAAVPLLRASVKGYRDAHRTDELGYAYALYNLGIALMGSGNPGGAITILEERATIPDQQETVREALRNARLDTKKLSGDSG
jgi:serine/threonine-protein kinase